MQIRIGQCDEEAVARRRDGEGIVFVMGAMEVGGTWGCEKEKGLG